MGEAPNFVWRLPIGDTILESLDQLCFLTRKNFRSLHGDGGILNIFDGPFESEEKALIDAGNLAFNPHQ